MRVVARRLVQQALKGNMLALKEIAERHDPARARRNGLPAIHCRRSPKPMTLNQRTDEKHAFRVPSTPPPASIVGSSGTSTAPVATLEVLTRCLQSGDDRIAMMAAQAILDRGYGRPTQSIDANISDGPRFATIAEVPEKSATTQEWLESIRREDAGRSLVTSVAAAVDDEQTH